MRWAAPGRQRVGVAALPVAITVAFSVMIAGPAFAADRYIFDSAHCIPSFEFVHLGVTTQTGRFDKAGGTIVLDFGARKGSVTYEIDTATLNLGFGTETPDSPGYRLFDVKRYPKISFKSTRLTFDKGNKVIAAVGQLTLLGVTRPLTVTVKRFKCAVNPMNKRNTCAGEVTATVKRSEFGMVAYIPGISDEIKISVPVEAYQD
ncbi:MAG: YceI family protein [Burkholderiales bacterium]